jgi:hypothetical protein
MVMIATCLSLASAVAALPYATDAAPPVDPVIEEPIRPLYPEDVVGAPGRPANCGSNAVWMGPFATWMLIPLVHPQPARRRH